MKKGEGTGKGHVSRAERLKQIEKKVAELDTFMDVYQRHRMIDQFWEAAQRARVLRLEWLETKWELCRWTMQRRTSDGRAA